MPGTIIQDTAAWWGDDQAPLSPFVSAAHDTTVAAPTVVSVPMKTFFPGHPSFKGPMPLAEQSESPDWIFILIIFLLIIVAALRYTYDKRMSSLVSAVFSRTASSQMLREYNIVNSQLFLPLFLIYVTSISLFSYIIIDQYSDNLVLASIPSWQVMILLFVGHVTFMLLKVLLMNLSGYIFETRHATYEYIHNLFLFNFFAGIMLLPMLILVLYSGLRIFFFASLVIILLIFITRFFRGFLIGLNETRFSIFHLFLYLCTLEILPLAVIAKFALKYA